MPKLTTHRSDDLIPAESRKLPTWLNGKNNLRREKELLTVVVHRPYPGDHELSEKCWCHPVIDDTSKTVEEVADEAQKNPS